jgi:hypothetical protein
VEKRENNDMDPVLSELYGTLRNIAPEPSQEELQKTAALELLQKIAEDNGIDLNQLSDEQIVEAYNELVGGFDKTASADEDDMAKLAAEEMLRNADFMGRTIAHAIVNELAGIQKAAEEAAAEESKAEEGEKKNPLAEAVKAKKEEGEEEAEEGEEKKAYANVVEARAYDLLKQAGYVAQDGSIIPPQGFNKEAQVQIDRDALQVLEEMGYPVNWAR